MQSSQSFDEFLTSARQEPDFESQFQAELSAIRIVDQLVNELDGVRQDAGLSKQDLAMRLQMNPAQVRRLFTKTGQNPTLKTFILVAQSMGLELALVKASAKSRTLA
jgi:DNA-binding phage protein